MTFSLLDEPWLPLVTTDGSNQQGSLREALLEPSRWAGLDAAHPLPRGAVGSLDPSKRATAGGPFDQSCKACLHKPQPAICPTACWTIPLRTSRQPIPVWPPSDSELDVSRFRIRRC